MFSPLNYSSHRRDILRPVIVRVAEDHRKFEDMTQSLAPEAVIVRFTSNKSEL